MFGLVGRGRCGRRLEERGGVGKLTWRGGGLELVRLRAMGIVGRGRGRIAGKCWFVVEGGVALDFEVE